jgi:hypothetical protein
MATLTKQHARTIAKKLGAEIDTSPKAHDLALVRHNGAIIATFGIRRGSNKNLPHGHIANDLHISPRQAMNLASCSMTPAQWLERLEEQNVIESPEPETPNEDEE